MKNCIFVLDREINSVFYWKCENNNKFKCKARVHTKNDEIIKTVGEHNHSADKAGLMVKKTLNCIKEQAINTAIAPTQLFANSSIHIHDSVAARLPSVRLVRKMIHRKRKARPDAAGHDPKKRCDIIIPEEYKLSLKNENFLFYDSGHGDKERILIFSTENNMKRLEKANHIYCDGTFSSCPLIFQQIFTIHEIVGSYVIPLVYCLLPNKKESTYTAVLKEISKDRPMNPITIMTDFEMAEINAFKKGKI